ncbi:YmdB family metallophosphoesterase [Ruminococcaceae bacterium OttesenSCG-928-A16]|nr:YmdB family metallophosphoesterase [Ruminococcaceae bacterium OttesenSCG-928-A16]
MKILCVGDVVGQPGLDYLCEILPLVKQQTGADFVIVNGENSDKSGTGLTRHGAQTLLQHANVVTTGNHCYRRAGEELYTENETVLHPANFPYTTAAAGCCLIDTGRHGVVRVINLMGTAWMEPVDNPFKRADELLAMGDARYTIVDFHAESTAEKKALAFYLDGRVSAIFGTHTHVQTADEQILPAGTGYITDVGMVGPISSVLGIQPQLAVQKQRTHGPVQFAVAEGPAMLNAALFTLDDTTGLCTEVQRIDQRPR